MSEKSEKTRGKSEPTAADILARDVIRGIYEGYYVAGQRLAEPDLGDRYGLSRSSVREGLKQLAADGIVVLLPFKGAQIRKLTRREAENLFSITEVILGLAARQAAAHIDEDGARDKLTASFEAIAEQRESDDRHAFIRHRNRYFRTLVDINGNDELWRLLPKLQVHLIRNRLAVPRDDRIQGYREITDAILSGDEDAAEQAARRYVRKTASCALPEFTE
ncbi:GntR family transcriptional regulator [Salipiger abyssi]|uniref:GntR family transcriptional regulator n=1 Tax=Salipiger abyssi TaxID=1250539 RepID=UPI001A8C0922|nr:GntR family transcriptional regulator [Salipiger abyssi]MBN9887155.1 GntR family transcriptional regulator [Salipiger abyssi]